MTLAIRIEELLEASRQRQAVRDAARAARDAFVQAQFPVLNARLLELVHDAVGVHSRISVTAVPETLAVVGRTFVTLPRTLVTVLATVDTRALAMRFEPMLDSRDTDQFGSIRCTIDFDARLRRSREAAVARALLDTGIQMRGTAGAHLVIAPFGAWIEARADHIESALAELLLR